MTRADTDSERRDVPASAPTPPAVVRADTDTPVDWPQMAAFIRQMLITLDGLWFMNILEKLGPEQTLDVDICVFQSQFKIATRLVRKMQGLDGTSIDDKVQVFRAMAHLYGHRFDILEQESDAGKTVTMRLHQCAFYENLKKAGRESSHDCRILCRQLAPAWFGEIEPRTSGEGSVDLQLPKGGPHCDWTVVQPMEV